MKALRTEILFTFEEVSRSRHKVSFSLGCLELRPMLCLRLIPRESVFDVLISEIRHKSIFLLIDAD